jgi:hypothetical protein
MSGPYKIIVVIYIGFLLSVIISNLLALIVLKFLRPPKLPNEIEINGERLL